MFVRAHVDAPCLAVEKRELEGSHLPRRAPSGGVVGAELEGITGVDEARPADRLEPARDLAAHVQPEVAGVGVEGRAKVGGRGGLVVLPVPGHLDARAPVPVVQPQLGALVRDHVLAVRCPDRRHVVLPLGVGELARPAPVRAGHPDVLGAVAVAHEHQHRAIGRVARLHVVRLPAGDARRVAPRDGERVQVAEQLEHDRLPVRRQIERDPRPLVGREVQGAGGNERQRVGVTCLRRGTVVLLGGLRGRGAGLHGRGEQQREDGEDGQGGRGGLGGHGMA